MLIQELSFEEVAKLVRTQHEEESAIRLANLLSESIVKKINGNLWKQEAVKGSLLNFTLAGVYVHDKWIYILQFSSPVSGL